MTCSVFQASGKQGAPRDTHKLEAILLSLTPFVFDRFLPSLTLWLSPNFPPLANSSDEFSDHTVYLTARPGDLMSVFNASVSFLTAGAFVLFFLSR